MANIKEEVADEGSELELFLLSDVLGENKTEGIGF
jgi:hypothetical protein